MSQDKEKQHPLYEAPKRIFHLESVEAFWIKWQLGKLFGAKFEEDFCKMIEREKDQSYEQGERSQPRGEGG